MHLLWVLESLPGARKVDAPAGRSGHAGSASARRWPAWIRRRGRGRSGAVRPPRTPVGPVSTERNPLVDRDLRPRRRRQGHDRRPGSLAADPRLYAEPVVDHPGAPAGRGARCLPLRRPEELRGPRRGRRLPRVGRVPRLPPGQPRAPTRPSGSDVLFEIDVAGAARIKELYPEALLVFVDAPDRADQEATDAGRGDDPEPHRPAPGQGEPRRWTRAAALPYVHVVNDDLDRAVVREAASLIAERARARMRPGRPAGLGIIVGHPRPWRRHPGRPTSPLDVRATCRDHRHDDEPRYRGAPRSSRFQVLPGRHGRPPRPGHQHLLLPARRGPVPRRGASAGRLHGPQAAVHRLRGDRRRTRSRAWAAPPAARFPRPCCPSRSAELEVGARASIPQANGTDDG